MEHLEPSSPGIREPEPLNLLLPEKQGSKSWLQSKKESFLSPQ